MSHEHSADFANGDATSELSSEELARAEARKLEQAAVAENYSYATREDIAELPSGEDVFSQVGNLEFSPLSSAERYAGKFADNESEIDVDELESEFIETLHVRLSKIGLSKYVSIGPDAVAELKAYSPEAIETMYLHIWEEMRDEFGPFSRVTLDYLIEETIDTDLDDLQQKKLKQSTEDLIRYGLNPDEVLDTVNAKTDAKAQALIVIAWLLNTEPSLEELRSTLEATAESTKISLEQILANIQDTIGNTQDALGSINTDILNSRKKLRHKGETTRLKYIAALADSVVLKRS